ncbi:MAG: SIS domain-containing protein [Micrococcales bacterium]|nr:SIS domain-containing protein [Micrococcales bacterium]
MPQFSSNPPHVTVEIGSQPECWTRAAEQAPDEAAKLPQRGERVAVIGCGTSWFMAMAYAYKRESAGHGVTDAFAASSYRSHRDYDCVVAISRSGTTSEVAAALAKPQATARSVAILGVVDSPIAQGVDQVVDLGFADEQSVVQTRFATSTLALLRAHLGEDLEKPISQAEQAVQHPLNTNWLVADQVAYLGQGWTIGIAHEAALKMREASQGWAESYRAMEYRHGPISIAQPGRLVWMFGPAPAGLEQQVRETGASWIAPRFDPMAALVVAQRLAVERALVRGMDPDRPRHLSRSVVLEVNRGEAAGQ